MSDSSRHSVAIIAESTFGTIPASPAFQNLRVTSCNLALNKASAQSEELRQDRQIAHFKMGSEDVGGDLGFDFSYGTFDMLLEAALGGTWSGNVLKAGTQRRSFTVERYFGDIAPADKPWHRYLGCEVNSMALTIPTEGNVTGTFSLMGKEQSLGSAILTGASYTAATTTDVIDSFTGTFNEGGSASGIITEVTLNLQNGLTKKPVAGSKHTLQHSIGRSNLSGQVTVYFENAAMYEKFLNEQESSLSLTLTDGSNNYTILIPRIIYTAAQIETSGEGAIFLPLPFQALRDDTEGSNITITRS